MTTAGHRRAAPGEAGFHQRLLDALAGCIAERGYRATTVADVVGRARTSRRTFYQHFPDKEGCFIALVRDSTAETIRRISDAVEPSLPWREQVARAVEAWVRSAEAQPAITLSWIRDMPSLGAPARALQRDVMEDFIAMIQRLADNDELRAAGIGPVPRQLAIVLLGGLRELIATTVEDGGRAEDITDVATRAAIALLTPTPPS